MYISVVIVEFNSLISRTVQELLPGVGDLLDVAFITYSKPLNTLDFTIKGSFKVAVSEIYIKG